MDLGQGQSGCFLFCFVVCLFVFFFKPHLPQTTTAEKLLIVAQRALLLCVTPHKFGERQGLLPQ